METSPLVAELVAEVDELLAEEPALTAPELRLAFKPTLVDFLEEVRGPNWVRISGRLEDRPPLEREFLEHPSFKELCRRYGDAVVALHEGGWS